MLAEQAKANTNTLFDSSAAAVDGHEGWLSAPALRTCGLAWHRRLTELIDQSRRAGKDLTSCTAAASAMDQEAADRLHEVLEDMSGYGPARNQGGGHGGTGHGEREPAGD